MINTFKLRPIIKIDLITQSQFNKINLILSNKIHSDSSKNSKYKKTLKTPLIKKDFNKTLKKKKDKKLSYSQNAVIQTVPITFSIILKSLLPDLSDKIDRSINQVVTFHNNMIKNHGVVEGTARYNSIRLYAVRLLEGQNPDNPGRVAVSHKFKWPSGLCELLPFYKRVLTSKCASSDRIIRSILYLNRLCEGNDVLDVKNITREFVVSEEFILEFKEYLARNSKALSDNPSELFAAPSVRVVSNGPNGKPKWQTADVEAYTLIKSEYNVHFKALCEATGNLSLHEYMENRASTQDRVERKRLRYITSIRDKGNKNRGIAISDYWTQVLLEPIMRDIQKLTSKRWEGISFTMSHSDGFKAFQKNLKPGSKSYDLTAWTDGLPAVLQRMVLEARYGSKIAESWYNLVVDCKWDVKGSKESIKYGTGQGMGTAGSFDIATLTDLELLNMVYNKHYGTDISKYNTTKVGDDLVIFDPKDHIYKYYTVDIGMEINKSKTKESTKENLCGEFVSRNINYGAEVSRISANICRAVKKNILDLPQLSSHLQERGITIAIPLPEILESCKVEGILKNQVLRTLYLLSSIYGKEMWLLKKSLKVHYYDFIAADEILSVYATSLTAIDEFKRLFDVYQVGILLNSIIRKSDDLIDGIQDSEIPSSEILRAESATENLWSRKEDSIEFLTSIIILSRSFKSMNEMYKADEFTKVRQIVNVLMRTEQSMTFRELGVISSTDEVWRPKATKLFNLCKSLSLANPRILDYTLLNIDKDKPQEIFNALVQSKILLPYSDPIFKGVKDIPMIGTTNVK